MNSLINFYNGKILHQRLGKVKHKFINLHLFLLINISNVKSCNMSYVSGKVRLLSINKFNILSWYVKDHGDRKNRKSREIERIYN